VEATVVTSVYAVGRSARSNIRDAMDAGFAPAATERA
jgi:hypothetical protein